MFDKLIQNLKGDSARAKAARGFIVGTIVGALVNKELEDKGEASD